MSYLQRCTGVLLGQGWAGYLILDLHLTASIAQHLHLILLTAHGINRSFCRQLCDVECSTPQLLSPGMHEIGLEMSPID